MSQPPKMKRNWQDREPEEAPKSHATDVKVNVAVDQPLPQNSVPESSFAPRPPVRSMDDLIVSDEIKDELLTLIERIQNNDTLQNEWGLSKLDPNGSRTVLNFYGPPGTGKTLAAEAVASYLGKDFLDINYSELESKYVGETGKNITRAFETARQTEAVLFFDEADSILGKRLSDVRQSSDHAVNQSRSVMLKEIERFDGVLIFATNLFSNYDSAFLRRILGSIHFGLPSQKERQRLWEHFLLPTIPRSADINPETLSELGDGLSGGDLLNVLKRSAADAVRRQGERRKLYLDDIRTNIERVKASKVAHERTSSMNVQTLNIKDPAIPQEVRDKFAQTNVATDVSRE